MPNSQLFLRNNTYYLRIRDDQKDRRISLKTRNFEHANVLFVMRHYFIRMSSINSEAGSTLVISR